MNIRGIGNNGEWLCCSPILLRKKELKIDTLKFEDYEELVCFVCDKFDEIKEMDGDVTVIAKYNDAKEILKELLCIGHDVISFDIHMPEWEGYKDPYSITICKDGIWCTKSKNENNEYYDELSDVVYIFSDCSSAILKKIETKFVYEVSVGEDDDSECDGDCDNCDLHELENENQSDSDVKITINGKPATAGEALEVVKELESRMEHMNDIYREMDAFRKLFNW